MKEGPLLKYTEAIDYLDEKVFFGVKPSLDRIRLVCQELGDPQRSYDSIQVTGTNGKSSVAHMMSRVLTKAGFKVGRFTSPHLETVRERIAVRERLISPDAFAATLEKIMPAVERAEKAAGPLTYFEVVTAIAYRYFEKSGVDVAVFEVGLGGAWDATNLVDSEVAVLTNVELDHTRELGGTREEIAREKVEVIKEGSRVITAEGTREILLIIAEKCEQVNADLEVFGRDFRLMYWVPYFPPGRKPGQVLSIRGLEGEYIDIRLPLVGKHQSVNAACAVAAAEAYASPRGGLEPDMVKKALEGLRVEGRLENLAVRPWVVADGAHNPSAVAKLASTLVSDYDFSRLVMVVAILQDKDVRGMLAVLGTVADELILTENRSTRSSRARDLAMVCSKLGLNYEVEPGFSQALERAKRSAGSRGMVCITGSMYTVAEARAYYRHQEVTKEIRQDR